MCGTVNYLSIDLSGVTVTVEKEDLAQFLDLLRHPVDESNFYEGWVTEHNPSVSSVGFAVRFEGGMAYADFHNLPFYYKDGWDVYHNRIIARVREHREFRAWTGHACRFESSLPTGAPGSQYEGFPRVSFERAIGHVFFRCGTSRYCYVNGLMLTLRHSSHERRGTSLLRGRRYLERVDRIVPWVSGCATALPSQSSDSYTMRLVRSVRPPLCLTTYPGLPSLDPRSRTFEVDMLGAIKQAWSFACPFERGLRSAVEELRPAIERFNASPFDVPITFLRSWAEQQWA